MLKFNQRKLKLRYFEVIQQQNYPQITFLPEIPPDLNFQLEALWLPLFLICFLKSKCDPALFVILSFPFQCQFLHLRFQGCICELKRKKEACNQLNLKGDFHFCQIRSNIHFKRPWPKQKQFSIHLSFLFNHIVYTVFLPFILMFISFVTKTNWYSANLNDHWKLPKKSIYVHICKDRRYWLQN